MTLPPADAVQVHAAHQAGSGRAITPTGVYPLGALTYGRAANGRGVVDLEAGAGRLQLAGRDADETSPGRWRLKIDRMGLLAVRPAHGSCGMVMTSAPPSYVSLRCTIQVGDDPRSFTVDWRGDGSAATPR